MYMWLKKVDLWKISAYLLETNWMAENGLVYPVPHDKRMIIIDVKADLEWREKLDPAVKNVISLRDMYYQKLVAKFGAR